MENLHSAHVGYIYYKTGVRGEGCDEWGAAECDLRLDGRMSILHMDFVGGGIRACVGDVDHSSLEISVFGRGGDSRDELYPDDPAKGGIE